jgi:citrate lyase gamma subunit
VDVHLSDVSKAQFGSDPEGLVLACAALQRASVDFSRAVSQFKLKGAPDKVLKVRIQALAALLASRREALVRQSVMVEMALSALVPASVQHATYAPKSGAYGRQPYASAGRQSGEFRAFSA